MTATRSAGGQGFFTYPRQPASAARLAPLGSSRAVRITIGIAFVRSSVLRRRHISYPSTSGNVRSSRMMAG